MSRTTFISVVAVMDDASESASSQSKIRISRENCNGHRDIPMIYGQVPASPGNQLTPGAPVTFKFRGDDTDASSAAYPNQFGAYNWRFRNMDTGQVITTVHPNPCAGSDQDNKEQTINTVAPNRGRWVVEAELMSLGTLLEPGGCPTETNPDDPAWGNSGGHWFWVGAVDVNSPQAFDGDSSPNVTLSVPSRPEIDGSLAISARPAKDPFDTLAGGKVQSLEWDLNDDETDGVDGFETVRLGDSRTGLASGQDSMLLDTSDRSPGVYHVRARVGDNGALGAADDIRRTTVSDTRSYLVNTPPTAQNLAVTTDYGKSIATPLVADDTNVDADQMPAPKPLHDPLTWSLLTAPAHGYLSGEWPNRTYHPDSGFSGTDSFVFRVDDGYGGTATGTVTVTVNPKPVDPVDPDPGEKKDHLEATFPEARMNLNEQSGPKTSGVKVVDSTVSDPPVTFKTDYWDRTTGAIDAPAADLKFPPKSVQLSVTDPIPLNLDVKIEFGAVSRITGNYNATSGTMSLNFNAHALITITAGNGNIQVMTCDVTPMPLAFSSSGAPLVDPGEGAPANRPARTWKAAAFKPVAREGAITSLWNSLPASTALSEPLAPTVDCGGTLDPLIANKGGFWLGGKVTVEGGDPVDPPKPGPDTAVFDGKRLHIGLMCGSRFKPKCASVAVPLTMKDKVRKVRKGKKVRRVVKRGKPMANQVRKAIRSGKWVKVSFLIKPQFRARVLAMSRKKTRQLVVRQVIRAKKIGKRKTGGKAFTLYHRYRVRSAR